VEQTQKQHRGREKGRRGVDFGDEGLGPEEGGESEADGG
jgi:hypothetical protein